MRSKDKSLRDLSCLGRGGDFKKLWNGEVESGTGGLKNRIKSVKLLRRGGDPVYEPVKGLTPLDISGPVMEKPDARGMEEFVSIEGLESLPDSRPEDLNIYAPLSVSSVLAGIQFVTRLFVGGNANLLCRAQG